MPDSGPPAGRLARAATLGRAAVAAGAAEARRRLPGADPAADDGAQVLFAALGQLKGTALKLAQMLSLETDLLPPRLADELSRAHYRSPSLSWPTVADMVERELGRPTWEAYARLSPTAFAAASLGQVHAARGHDGRELAVKVQYPGIRGAAHADVQMMRALVRRLPSAGFGHVALDEFEARLVEELDYRREAQATESFREALAPLGVQVPEIVPKESTARVLTMTRLPGAHVDEWLATGPDQAAIDRAAQRLWDVFLHGLRRLHWLHADTNLGNYLFGAEGAVGVIDFGCTKRVAAPTVAAREALMRALLASDTPEILAAYRRLDAFEGALDAQISRHRRQTLAAFEEWLIRPLRDERFDFAAHPTYCAEGREAFQRLAADRSGVRLPRDLVFVDRTQFGLYRLFARMGAAVALRGLIT